MREENRPFEAHRQPPADEPTAAALLRVVLSPTPLDLGGLDAENAAAPRNVAAPKVAETPSAARADYPEPSASAHMVIKTVPVTVELKGGFPASDASVIFATLSMTAAGMTGIVSALVTVYLATEHAQANLMPWFVGLAAAELGVAVAVIFRIGRRSHGGRPVPAVQQPRDPS
jgi:hypothetical protein